MKKLILMVTLLTGWSVFGAEIVDRPEKLVFPPLKFEPPKPADYRVVLTNGPVAYIIPDHELPLINIHISIHGGKYVVQKGKEGLEGMTTYLMEHGGTKSWTAEELEEKLAFLAAHLSVHSAGTSLGVDLNLLAKDLDEGMKILREVMTEPRFQDDKLTLARDQDLQDMRQRNDDSDSIEFRESQFLSYGENFWANRYSTEASIKGITKADMQAYHHQWFVPANMVVAVNGDFDREKMTAKLEELFGQWPFAGEKYPSVPTDTQIAKPGIYLVNKDVPQGRVTMILPGIMRDDPDYFAGVIMNDILGGGGFTSRIMSRVRSDEGLAYSAGSGFPGGVYFPYTFTASFQSKSRTVAYAGSIVIDEVKKLLSDSVTETELKDSKQSFIDRFPGEFANKAKIAGIFAGDEFTGRYARDPDFWKNYRTKIEKITKADVDRVAKRFLHPEDFAILIVGQKEDILKGHPEHEKVTLQSLSSRPIIDVPLRDPMTMKPMTAPK